ncbi:MAG: hypothetical protein OXN81_15505 [Alphaproteobacteria bacterium]|nr:hypothetical protein [Alphaproteobacteria bacterium]
MRRQVMDNVAPIESLPTGVSFGMAATFDTLAAAEALEAAGVKPEHAKAHVTQ